MKVTEIPEVSSVALSLAGKRGVEFEGYRVAEWSPPEDDTPTEVHIVFEVKDSDIVFAQRFKSADAVDRHIAILRRHRNAVVGQRRDLKLRSGGDSMDLVHHGDCLDAEAGLPSLAGRIASAIITDPPYSEWTHAKFGKEKRSDGHAARAGLKFKPLKQADIERLAYEFVRVAQRWIVVFTDDRSITPWGNALERAGGRWVRTGYWVKTSPMPQMSGDRPGVGAEPVVIGYAAAKGRMRWNGGGHVALWRGPTEPTATRLHPAQKPLWLMEELVDLFADQGELVLDPFAGSGTTGVACHRKGRVFRGWETDRAMAGTARARLAGELRVDPHQLDLLGREGKAHGR